MPSFNHELLRTVRLDLGMTQEDAASALAIDVRTYRRYESGAVNEGGEFEVRQPARRRLLRKLCEQFGVAEESAWLVQSRAPAAMPASAPRERAVHCVQPLAPARHFVGRSELLAWLSAWRSDTATAAPRAVAVIGVGGAGKTSLVERYLAGLRGEGVGGGVFAWSFYDDARVEALLSRALAYFAGANAPAEGSALDGVLDALRAGPRHLIVLDGLEAVQSEGGDGLAFGELEDPALRRLVRALAAGHGNARLLATSRFALTDLAPWDGAGAHTVLLGDLARGDALALLRAWGIRGADADLAPLVDRAGGHALSVAMLGSYVGSFLDGDPARLAPAPADAAGDDALARRLSGVLTAYATALPASERDLLARVSLFPNGADPVLLVGIAAAGGGSAGALAGADEAGVLRGLAKLERLGLLSRSRDAAHAATRYTAHPFVREHFKSLLGVPAARVHEAALGVLAAGLRGRPAGAVSDPDTLDRYEALIERAIDAGRAEQAWAAYERGMGGFENLGLRLGAMARGARVTQRFAVGAVGVRADLGPELRASIAYDAALYAGALGDLALARRWYEWHQRVAAEGGEMDPAVAAPRRAMGLRTLGYTAWLQGDLARAAALVAHSIDLARAGGYAFHQVRGLALLAAIEHDRGRAAACDESLRAAIEADGSRPSPRRALWEAEVWLARGDIARARALGRGSLEDAERRGWAGHVAHARTVLGEADLTSGDAASARASVSRVGQWVRASGEVEVALRCHELAARVALAAGDATAASEETRAGLALAVACGFGLAQARLGALAARARLLAGDARGAADEAQSAIVNARERGYPWGEASALRVAGEAARAMGLHEEAQRAFAQERAVRERTA